MMVFRLFQGNRSRVLVISSFLCLLIFLASTTQGCGCSLKNAIDQASLTARGLRLLNEIKTKAGDGYDVREVRARWLEALDVFSKGDLQKASLILDDVERLLPAARKVGDRIFYRSSGGLKVSGLLFKPGGDPPWPVVSVNHPGFGEAAEFSDVGIVFAEHGYLAFVPDFRGSGKSEGKNELAKGEVDDVIRGIEYLKSLQLVEDDRIAMVGQSHGATVSLLAAARYKKVRCVVAEAGFSDAVDGYNHIISSQDPAAKELLAKIKEIIPGTPAEYPEEFAVRSPINFVDDIDAAVLLIHGEKDPIVPVDQARKLYAALRRANKEVEIKIYPEEAHCVSNPVLRAEVWNLTFEWLKKHGV